MRQLCIRAVHDIRTHTHACLVGLQAIRSYGESVLTPEQGSQLRALRLKVLGKGGFGMVTLCETASDSVRCCCNQCTLALCRRLIAVPLFSPAAT